jgi:hypothetical protein
MIGANSMSVRFEINIIKVGTGFPIVECGMLTCKTLTGSMVAALRDSIPASLRGWMAVPNVGEAGVDGAQVVMMLSLSSFSFVLLPASLLPFIRVPSMMHDPPLFWWRNK